MLGQQAVGDRLRDAEDIGVRAVQTGRPGLVDGGEEPACLEPLSVREEPLQQPALVHHLDAAHMQAERTDDLGRLRRLLQHDHPHTVQPQLGGQHQTGRSATGDDHVEH